MSKKIGTDFHMVANDIYQAYDEGAKPQEKDLTELYELSKEFVKDYEERKEKEITYEQIRAFTDQFDNNCSDGWITEIVNGEVDIDKLKSFILTHYEEHKDEDGKKVLDEDIEGYFTKDNCDEIFVKTEKEKTKGKDYTPPIVCTYCHSSNVDVYKDGYILETDASDNVGYQGYCHECKKEKTLTTLEEKGETNA